MCNRKRLHFIHIIIVHYSKAVMKNFPITELMITNLLNKVYLSELI